LDRATVIAFVVRNKLHWDEARDDAEWWPTITAYGEHQGANPHPFITGATDTAAAAWDLIESFCGNPPPAQAYRVTITPVGTPPEPEDMGDE
jgi:hypothetical protein